MNEQRNLNTPYEPGNPEHDNSVGGLLRQLTREVPSLFTKELALATLTMESSVEPMGIDTEPSTPTPNTER